jgi:sulfite exporter TauE/SafE
LIVGLLFFFLGELLTGSVLGKISKYIFILGGSFVIIMGLLMIASVKLESRVCPFFVKKLLLQDKKNIVILGLIIGLLPCAPLFAVFSSTMLVSKNWASFLMHVVSFGLGTLFSPLLLVVFFAGFIPKFFLNKRPVYSRILNFLCGIIMLFLGTQLIMQAWGKTINTAAL